MDELKERWKVSAWKTYTQWGVDGKGFFLSDEIGTRFIEKARALNVKVICVHKGLPFGKQSYEHSQCSDIGVVAKRFRRQVPDLPLGLRHRSAGARLCRPRRERWYRHANPLAGRKRCKTQQQRLRRARQHLAISHAPIPPARRMLWASSSNTAVRTTCSGHRFDLVRLAAGSDPGVPCVSDRPDLRTMYGTQRSRRPAGENLWPQRDARLRCQP